MRRIPRCRNKILKILQTEQKREEGMAKRILVPYSQGQVAELVAKREILASLEKVWKSLNYTAQ